MPSQTTKRLSYANIASSLRLLRLPVSVSPWLEIVTIQSPGRLNDCGARTPPIAQRPQTSRHRARSPGTGQPDDHSPKKCDRNGRDAAKPVLPTPPEAA